MDQTSEERAQKKILNLRKYLEREIEQKKILLNTTISENEELERENRLLEEWLLKYKQ